MRNIRKSAYGAMYLKEAFSSNQDSTFQGAGARRLTGRRRRTLDEGLQPRLGSIGCPDVDDADEHGVGSDELRRDEWQRRG